MWNVSEESYDTRPFGEAVLEYRFPGHPAPPLGLLFKMCTSIESWLDADAQNIAVAHCLTGKGRTATVLAAFLAWDGALGSPMEALDFVAERRRIDVDRLTTPSQRRYLQYFSNMLDGVKPRSEPLLLRRVIMNTVPLFGAPRDDAAEASAGNLGCCPYLQLFRGGKLIFTTAWKNPQKERAAAAQQQRRQQPPPRGSGASAAFALAPRPRCAPPAWRSSSARSPPRTRRA